ncbi:MAG: SGNH/GDSL hydrolase family protein [Lachnospiraceae bacterium]|nr:SGNH/GDSL hydrolase family protein [Lachnospiraceae bacterium]
MGKKIRVLCYGDSNTFGYIPGRGGRYNRHTRWPGRLQELLGSEYQVIEEGLCGRTTAFEDMTEPGRNGLDRVREAVERSLPLDVLVIMLGSNDCKAQFGASAAEIAGGLEQVAAQARGGEASGFRVLLVAPAAMTDRVMHSGFGSEFDQRSIKVSKELAEAYEALAGKCGCDFLDGSKVTQVSEIDGLHLDAEGHGRLAEAVVKYLQK